MISGVAVFWRSNLDLFHPAGQKIYYYSIETDTVDDMQLVVPAILADREIGFAGCG